MSSIMGDNMKFKPVYMYAGVFVIIIVLIFVFSQTEEPEITDPHAGNPHSSMNQGMPDDHIHNGMNMGGNMPGAGNVTGGIKARMDSLNQYTENNPEDTDAILEYAEILAAAHQIPKSAELLKGVLAKHPDRTDVMLTLTYVEFKRGNLDTAAVYTDKILKKEPLNPEAFYNKGAIQAAKGNNSEAREIWEDLINKLPDTHAAELAESSLKKL